MDVTLPPQKESMPWSAIRRRANAMGIPAWQLAENLSFHDKNGDLLVVANENEAHK
jgi:hypothetical protein